MMQSMLSNPDMMRSMIQMNPAMQQLMEQNPQLREVLNDPETMRQHMQAMSNPALMNEMMRQQDRAMANIEAHPQGFNALARMFSEVQQPLQEAQQQEAQQRSGGGVVARPEALLAQATVVAVLSDRDRAGAAAVARQ